jgi:hypothetical protein
MFIGEKGATDPIDGRRDRRKIDHDLVGKTADLVTAVLTRHDRHAIAADGTERVRTHELEVR